MCSGPVPARLWQKQVHPLHRRKTSRRSRGHQLSGLCGRLLTRSPGRKKLYQVQQWKVSSRYKGRTVQNMPRRLGKRKRWRERLQRKCPGQLPQGRRHVLFALRARTFLHRWRQRLTGLRAWHVCEAQGLCWLHRMQSWHVPRQFRSKRLFAVPPELLHRPDKRNELSKLQIRLPHVGTRINIVPGVPGRRVRKFLRRVRQGAVSLWS